MHARRGLVAVTVLVVAGGMAGSPVAARAPELSHLAHAAVPGCDDASIRALGDLDGDGVPEVVVGLPAYPGGGAVDVRFTGGGGVVLTAASMAVSARGGTDRFGAAVLVTELNGDRCADLVIGMPGHRGIGSVVVVLGDPTGYASGNAALVRAPARSAGSAFGASLAMADGADPAEPRTVAVGMPGYPTGSRPGAGAVVMVQLTGKTPTDVEVVTEDSPGVAGVAEAGDGFGAVLGAQFPGGVVVGTPMEDVGSAKDAGAVTLLRGDGTRVWVGHDFSEQTEGVPGVAEAGDRFGAAVLAFGLEDATVTVGIPGEDVRGVRDAGTVAGLDVSPAMTVRGAAILHQGGSWGSDAIPGVDEAGDAFGSALGRSERSGHDVPLVVGVPGEDVGTARDAGATVVFVHYIDDSGGFFVEEVTEADEPFGQYVEAGDRFGATMASGSFRSWVDQDVVRLVVGGPGEDVRGARDAGAVIVTDRMGPGRALTFSAGPRARLGYGAVLGVNP